VRQAGRGIGRAAVLIAVLTVIARLVGFGRQLVFAHSVGATCLGTAYATANQVPNIIYDIVLGGALTSAVIPVLAGPAAGRLGAPGGRARDAETGQIASALLTWTVVLLAPVAALIAVTAEPLVSVLLSGAPGCSRTAIVAVSARMLTVFAPQIVLYGLAVVLYGILQTHHRFTAPALAPVVSSLVVIGAYVAFVPLGGGYRSRLGALPWPAELMLSLGTTAGVAALAVTALGPALRLRLRLRPTLRFPEGVAVRVRGLAAVGIAALIAQDASVVAVIVLANAHDGQGALVLYNYGWQVFFMPYAVLAVPIATSAFPLLSARSGDSFNDTAAAATRAIMLVSWLGAGLLAGAAVPAARLFAAHSAASQLAMTFAAFAPGLVGYGLAANLSRVLFACGRSRVAAVGLVGGWLLVIAADVVAVALVPARWVVPVLGLGNTIGLTLSGVALLGAVGRARGRTALRGAARAAAAGLAGAVAGGAAGAAVSASLPVSGFISNAGVAALAAACVAVVFGITALLLDGGELRATAARVRGRLAR
jgi:putative peptidoglycan lipid II flippase